MIYAYAQASAEEKAHADSLLKQSELDANAISLLIKLAYKKGGIEYAEYRMEEFRLKGIQLLSDFSNKEIVESLTAMMNYVVNRNK